MASDSIDTSHSTPDEQIAYHKEMEQIAIRAGDFTKAEHHRKMQEIYIAMKESQPYKTPEEVSDEDHKIATSADKDNARLTTGD